MDQTKNPEPSLVAEPPWLAYCLQHLGLHERPGPESDPLIAEAFALCGLDPKTHDDSTTPWCACWLALCLEKSGIRSTRRPNARSYLDWGTPLLRPQYGCVVVFSRPEAGQANGHVGLLVSEDDSGGHIMVAGGNESDSVRIAPYRVDRLLGYRWPTGYAIG